MLENKKLFLIVTIQWEMKDWLPITVFSCILLKKNKLLDTMWSTEKTVNFLTKLAREFPHSFRNGGILHHMHHMLLLQNPCRVHSSDRCWGKLFQSL